jgi:vacuolar-type H+-ATPase subunit H
MIKWIKEGFNFQLSIFNSLRRITVSFESLEQVLAAEEEARHEKQKAETKAESAINETINSGKKTIAQTLSRAEIETAHLIRATDQKATDEARVLASKTANRQAMQRARAERLLDKAADFIYERIVNG